MEKIKFSIIIPVYNVSKYLDKCISSVLEQTYNDYEVILVNDGSLDDSGKICDQYAKTNKKIKVFHKENGGLSSARNYGLKYAIGEYIIFLDSDDFWGKKEFLEDVDKIIKNKDLIIFNSFKYFEENKICSKSRFEYDEKFYELNNDEKIKYVIKNNIFKACAWDKIIKKSILIDNNIEFPIGKLSEDMEWAGKIISVVKEIDIYFNAVYAYRQRGLSISKSVSEKHVLDILNQIDAGVKKKDENVLNYFAYEYIILMGYSYLIKDKSVYTKVKELSWLLDYDVSKKVKKVKLLRKILGFKITCIFLKIYIKNK